MSKVGKVIGLSASHPRLAAVIVTIQVQVKTSRHLHLPGLRGFADALRGLSIISFLLTSALVSGFIIHCISDCLETALDVAFDAFRHPALCLMVDSQENLCFSF